MSLKASIERGDLDAISEKLKSNPKLATKLIKWGPILCPCRTEPLHFLSDGPFNQLWNHEKQAQIATILIQAGAPVDGLPDSSESPLHGAASLGEPGVAEVLIDHGANLEIRATYPGIPDGTPLDFAVHFGMVEVVDLLMEKGADVSSARMAAGAGLLDLLKKKIQPDQMVDVFRCACVCDRTEIVEYLFEEGLDVNVDIKGATALHWAAWEAKPRMVEFLIKNGAVTNRRDKKHNMIPHGWAMHRAKEAGPRWGHEEVLKYLSPS